MRRNVVGLNVSAAATVAAAATLLLAAGPAAAQVKPPPGPEDAGTVLTVVPGERYRAGPIRRFFTGSNYRVLWLRPVEVEVLDLDRWGGGIEPEESGGNQSKTLHFIAADGREYIFKSVDKYVAGTLPPDLRHTVISDLAQGYVSAHHPGSAFVMPPLREALGLLTVRPVYRIMPDDPRLGEFRAEFAGLLGTMIERPNEGEGDRPLFGGFRKIIGHEELEDKLEEHPRNRVDAREYLTARLLDFLVGDPDRGPDQWRWARVPETRGFRWRPIPRDPDYALLKAEGVVARLARAAYPKLVAFGPRLPALEGMTWSDKGMGRLLLTDLDRDEWDGVVEQFQLRLTDDVIEEAVRQLPPPHLPGCEQWLTSSLRARRDALPGMAAAFYGLLAEEVDVRGTDRPDRAEIVRHADGSVEVTLYARQAELVAVAEDDDDGKDGDGATNGDADSGGWLPYYRRRFVPEETKEVRVYLHGGDDMAEVRGDGPGTITVRLIGGGGDDALYDLGAGGGSTALYDSRGDNELHPGSGTRVDRRPFEPRETATWLEARGSGEVFRDWGNEFSWFKPVLDYREGAGVVLGAGPEWTDYGFRREPAEAVLGMRALVGTLGGFGLEAHGERWRENSPMSFRVDVRASQLEAVRFYGYGNDSPRLSSANSLIERQQVRVAPAVRWRTPRLEASFGPVLAHTAPEVPALNPAAAAGLPGTQSFTQAGAVAAFDYRSVDDDELPTHGFRLSAGGSGYPGVAAAAGPFAGARIEGRAYAPVPFGSSVALRAGARRAWGDFPIHEAARVGGSETVRGYRWQRFAGDGAVYGGAELRIPLFRMELLTKGRLGVLGLADAGRVYLDGASPGGWHTGYGAGLWFATMGSAVHGVWARGEEDRFYLGMGLPF